MKRNWNGQKVLIIGAARQGLALARFLSARGAVVTVSDQRGPDELADVMAALEKYPICWKLGEHALNLLEATDVVCVSGGVPLSLPILVEARRRGIPLTNDTQIFMEAVRAPVIGITGSAGKTTTTTLVGRMAEYQAGLSGRKTWVGGNIGMPLVEYVDEIAPEDLVIVEISSFQLELMTISPSIGAVLNVTPNHLDRHGTLEAYTAAKARLLDFQDKTSVAVLNREDPGSWGLVKRVKGSLVSFGMNPPKAGLVGTFLEGDQVCCTDGKTQAALMPVSVCGLRGEHNLMNVLAACAIGQAAQWSADAMRAGVQGFQGVAHRLEWVRNLHGVNWYNDSIATAPERTIAAIQAFDEPLVLLLGGRDKNLPWEKLAELIHNRVSRVVVFGEAAEKIIQAVQGPRPGSRLQSLTRCAGLREAVLTAAQSAQPGDVVLLSPGGTSFDEFKDFEQRGERFREWVKALL